MQISISMCIFVPANILHLLNELKIVIVQLSRIHYSLKNVSDSANNLLDCHLYFQRCLNKLLGVVSLFLSTSDLAALVYSTVGQQPRVKLACGNLRARVSFVFAS